MVKKASIEELAEDLKEAHNLKDARQIVESFLTDKRVKVTPELRKAIQFHIEHNKSAAQIHFLIDKKLSLPTIRKIIKESGDVR